LGPGAPLPSQRRVRPAAPAAEIASALTATPATPVPPSAQAEPPRESESNGTSDGTSEGGTIGVSEVGTRRRRRRGGRGRRAGVGGSAEVEAVHPQTSDVGEDVDEAIDEERPIALAAPATSPDDIDDAVLRLLASRDRDVGSGTMASTPAPVREAEPEPTPAMPAPVETPLPAFQAPALDTVPDEPPPAPRKRIARTSFGAFGPRDTPRAPVAATGVESGSELTPGTEHRPIRQEAGDPFHVPSGEVTAEATGAPADPDATLTGSDTSAGTTADVAEASTATGVVNDTAPLEAPSEASSRARSGRSGRSGGGRSRRSPGASRSGGTPAVESGSGDAAETVPATPRRRRTRQAAREAAAETPPPASEASA
jgi:hypothetical protein